MLKREYCLRAVVQGSVTKGNWADAVAARAYFPWAVLAFLGTQVSFSFLRNFANSIASSLIRVARAHFFLLVARQCGNCLVYLLSQSSSILSKPLTSDVRFDSTQS
jgi:hypothetical protein